MSAAPGPPAAGNGYRDMIDHMDRPFNDYVYVVIDVETTGVTRYDRVCEIGMTRITEGRIVETLETLINPCVNIANTRFHGIENWMVERAPVFEEFAGHMATFMKGAVLIAHNAHFDTRFLRYEFQRIGTDLSNYALCTLKMARRLHPDFPYHRLDYLLQRYRIVNECPHRAGADADSEAKLFLQMRRRLEETGLGTLESLRAWGLPYNHRWCEETAVDYEVRRCRIITRDDL